MLLDLRFQWEVEPAVAPVVVDGGEYIPGVVFQRYRVRAETVEDPHTARRRRTRRRERRGYEE